MFVFRIGFIICFSLFCIQASAGDSVIYNQENEIRPMPEGACKENHSDLIEEFVKEEFKKLQRQGLASPDDEYDGTTAHRQVNPLENGNTPYAMSLYGKTPEDQRIPPVDENDHPDGTRMYRCFGHLQVTSTCRVMMISTDFMDNEKLEALGKEALEELRDEAQRNGEEIKIDREGRIGVTVSVPQVQGFTCNRPPVYAGS